MKRAGAVHDKRVGRAPARRRTPRLPSHRGVDVAVYDEVKVEPTDPSFRAAAALRREGRFDGYVSVGGAR